jgi:hypothetical protein
VEDKMTMIGVRMPMSMRDDIERLAEADGHRPPSQFLRERMIVPFLEKQRKSTKVAK